MPKSTKNTYLNQIDAIFVFAGSLICYLLTLYPTVTSEDSGEFISSAYTLGISHPPGYPLYNIIGKLFTFIPFYNVAWRVNFMSAFISALSISILYIVLYDIFKNRFTSIVCSLMFAFSVSNWFQSVRAEVYTLNNFFIALIVFLSIKSIKSKSKKYLYLSTFALGLSLSNHHLMIFFMIPMVLLFFHLMKKGERLKEFAYLAGLFVLGLTPYIYLPIASSYDPVLNVANLDTLKGFMAHVARSSYGGSINTYLHLNSITEVNSNFLMKVMEWMSTTIISYYRSFFNLIPTFFSKLFSSYGYAFTLVGVLGFFRFSKVENIKTPIVRFINILFIFYSVVLIVLIGGNGDKSSMQIFIESPMYIPVIMLFTIYICAGLTHTISFIGKKYSGAGILVFRTTVVLLFFMLTIRSGLANYNRDNYLIYDYVGEIVNRVEDESIIVAPLADNIIFPFYYYQLVEGKKKNVVVIPSDESVVMETYLKSRANGKIYFNTLFDIQDVKKMKFDGVLFSEKSINSDKSIETFEENILLRGENKENLDIFHRMTLANYYLNLGAFYFFDDTGKRDYYFSKVVEIDSGREMINFIGDYFYQVQDYEKAAFFYNLASKNVNSYRNYIKSLIELGRRSRAEEALSELEVLVGKNIKNRINLSILYFDNGFVDKALASFLLLNKSMDSEMLRYYIGECFRLKNNTNSAEQYYRLSQLKNPGAVTSLIGFATLDLYHKRYDEAVVSYEKALVKLEKNSNLYGINNYLFLKVSTLIRSSYAYKNNENELKSKEKSDELRSVFSKLNADEKKSIISSSFKNDYSLLCPYLNLCDLF